MNTELNGINPQVFTENEISQTKGLNSGRDLITNIQPDLISITDAKDDRLQFEAKVRKETLVVTVKTRGYEGDPDKKHPDLFASQLVKKSLQFFELKGHSIAKWKDIWSKSGDLSDNWDQFEAYLQSHRVAGQEITQQQLRDAAQHTWTGHLAQELGFSQVESLDYRPEIGEVVVIFSKK